MKETNTYTVSMPGGEITCTACHYGPCIIGYYGFAEKLPEKQDISDEVIQGLPIPSECPLPDIN